MRRKTKQKSEPIVQVSLPQPEITKPNIMQEKQRFRDFLPINLGGDNVGEAARALIEKGDDERLKTEINAPVEMAVLKTVEKYLVGSNMPLSAEVLNTVIENYCSFMFSYKRHSRGEYIQAVQAFVLKALAEKQENLAQRLVTSEEVKR